MAAKKTSGLTAGICTSGSRVKIALLAGEKYYRFSKRCLNQEKALFPMLDKLLAARKARLAQLNALCVVSGPGRFTGLRVGLTLASTLKTLAGVRVWSVTQFEVLSAQASASRDFRTWASGVKEPRLAAVVHAFKDEYFCQIFEVTSHKTQVTRPIEPPRWMKDHEISAHLAAAGKGIYVIADEEEKPGIYSLVPPAAAKAPAAISKIMPEFIIKAGIALKNGDLSPLYLKPAKYEL